jgi:hypothetical protein
MTVRQGSQVTTLHSVLRHGRHVLVVPAAGLASVLHDARLRSYENDIHIVTGNAIAVFGTVSGRKSLVVLVRPDGHMAVRARPAAMDPVLDYLHDLFGDPGKGQLSAGSLRRSAFATAATTPGP